MLVNNLEIEYNTNEDSLIRQKTIWRETTMLLTEFAGNTDVKYELTEAMNRRSLPHAIIIEGDKGCGKKTLARYIAEYGVCSSEGERPCGVCPHCIKAQKGIHPDIMELDGNNSGELNIESIRNVRSAAYIKPNEAENKVYLLFNCDKMLMPAQNAFLKVLEEPPENVMFILTVVSSTILLQTVRSRARIFSLYPPLPEEAERVLCGIMPEKTREEINHAVISTGGNIGAAAELLSSGGEEEIKLAEEILGAVPQPAEYQLLMLTNRLSQNRAFAVKVLDRLSELTADCVRASLGAKNASPKSKELASKMSVKRLNTLQKNVQHARDVLNINVNLGFYSTWLCAVLRSSENGG